ncbi:protein GAPT [Sorex araneus]|uniref:protein GAPT n=1 Tax=Sorex araneus TaxID=42254 RepID=UPI00243351BF|nr:protein GAPT [Sorex araneus]
MIRSYENTSVTIYIGISLFILLVMCVIGCFWHRKRCSIRKFTLPSILKIGRSRKLSSTSKITHQSQKPPVQTEDYIFAGGESKIEVCYENLKMGPLNTEEGKDDKLYENSQQSNFEDHIYGNEAPFDYNNSQKSGASEDCQDEDIYILPDKY